MRQSHLVALVLACSFVLSSTARAGGKVWASIGALGSLGGGLGSSGGFAAGAGLEATFNVWPSEDTRAGAFLQAELANSGRWRFDVGPQFGFKLGGLELGAAFETGDATHARSLGLHIAPFGVVLLDNGDDPAHYATLAPRLDVPVRVFGVGAAPRATLELVLTVKLGVPVGEGIRWHFG